MRKILIAIGAAMAVLLSGAIATASAATPPASAPMGLEGTVGTVQPARILDTRAGTPLAPNATRTVHVIGQGGIPSAGVSAVVANVTVTGPTSGGWLTVWPTGAPNPGTSNLNFSSGQTVPNLVVTKVGTDGAIQIFNGSPGTVNVIVDMTGYVAAPAATDRCVTYRGWTSSGRTHGDPAIPITVTRERGPTPWGYGETGAPDMGANVEGRGTVNLRPGQTVCGVDSVNTVNPVPATAPNGQNIEAIITDTNGRLLGLDYGINSAWDTIDHVFVYLAPQ